MNPTVRSPSTPIMTPEERALWEALGPTSSAPEVTGMQPFRNPGLVDPSEDRCGEHSTQPYHHGGHLPTLSASGSRYDDGGIPLVDNMAGHAMYEKQLCYHSAVRTRCILG